MPQVASTAQKITLLLCVSALFEAGGLGWSQPGPINPAKSTKDLWKAFLSMKFFSHLWATEWEHICFLALDAGIYKTELSTNPNSICTPNLPFSLQDAPTLFQAMHHLVPQRVVYLVSHHKGGFTQVCSLYLSKTGLFASRWHVHALCTQKERFTWNWCVQLYPLS